MFIRLTLYDGTDIRVCVEHIVAIHGNDAHGGQTRVDCLGENTYSVKQDVGQVADLIAKLEGGDR